jgi:hypothetical protein
LQSLLINFGIRGSCKASDYRTNLRTHIGDENAIGTNYLV